MILGKGEIEKLIKSSNPIINEYDASISMNNPAKVELRLGDKCYVSSQPNRIIDLSAEGTIVLKPNDIFFYQTFEKVNMPKKLAGHLSLKMKATAQGLLMSNQTQVDPGYSNYLFGMLYNLSSDEIVLEYKQPILTLEFYEVKGNSMSHSGDMANISFEEFCSTRRTSSLSQLSSKVEEMYIKVKESKKRNDVIFGIISAFIAILTVIIGVISITSMYKPDADIVRLSERVEYQEQQIMELKDKLEEYEKND